MNGNAGQVDELRNALLSKFSTRKSNKIKIHTLLSSDNCSEYAILKYGVCVCVCGVEKDE